MTRTGFDYTSVNRNAGCFDHTLIVIDKAEAREARAHSDVGVRVRLRPGGYLLRIGRGVTRSVGNQWRALLSRLDWNDGDAERDFSAGDFKEGSRGRITYVS